MDKYTETAIEDFCRLFPNIKVTIDNANDSRRVTKIAYEAYKHSDDIDMICAEVSKMLSEKGCRAFQQVVKELREKLIARKQVLMECDNLGLLQ